VENARAAENARADPSPLKGVRDDSVGKVRVRDDSERKNRKAKANAGPKNPTLDEPEDGAPGGED